MNSSNNVPANKISLKLKRIEFNFKHRAITIEYDRFLSDPLYQIGSDEKRITIQNIKPEKFIPDYIKIEEGIVAKEKPEIIKKVQGIETKKGEKLSKENFNLEVEARINVLRGELYNSKKIEVMSALEKDFSETELIKLILNSLEG